MTVLWISIREEAKKKKNWENDKTTSGKISIDKKMKEKQPDTVIMTTTKRNVS